MSRVADGRPRNNTFKRKELLEDPNYRPDVLFEVIKERFDIKNHKDLCIATGLYESRLSKIKKKKAVLSPGELILLHDMLGMGLDEIRALAGMPKHTVEDV